VAKFSTEYEKLQPISLQRVADGAYLPVLTDCETADRLLVVIWPQLGDFDSLEYAWWLVRSAEQLQGMGVTVRAIGIGDRSSGQQFCGYTQFPADRLFVDPEATVHQTFGFYPGLTLNVPGLSRGYNAAFNLLLMCMGLGSPGTLAEVLRGYTGDRQAPQLIGPEEEVQAKPLPKLKGSFFDVAGGSGFQRPFELATLRLRNMVEVLGHWGTYVPKLEYITQRGGTFLFDAQGQLLYQHRDRGILGFAENMSRPLTFLESVIPATQEGNPANP
jgi:AhpC/TSA antioxidant enzyme